MAISSSRYIARLPAIRVRQNLRFLRQSRCARERPSDLWTHLDRPSNYKLTSCCESDQAEQESGHTESRIRCESALNDLLTNRGKPSRDLDHILADDPQFIIGHCLVSAIIVRADDIAARSKLLASVTALESMCPDVSDPMRRHAAAARAWLDGDEVLAVERYGAREATGRATFSRLSRRDALPARPAAHAA